MTNFLKPGEIPDDSLCAVPVPTKHGRDVWIPQFDETGDLDWSSLELHIEDWEPDPCSVGEGWEWRRFTLTAVPCAKRGES